MTCGKGNACFHLNYACYMHKILYRVVIKVLNPMHVFFFIIHVCISVAARFSVAKEQLKPQGMLSTISITKSSVGAQLLPQ